MVSQKKRPVHASRISINHSESEIKKSPHLVCVSHILIKHNQSRNKKSWKDPKGVTIQGTTLQEAKSILNQLREEITSGKVDFADHARKHSDCSSAMRDGALRAFGPGEMQKPFEEAAFALKVGEISEIVETASGVHIIKRTSYNQSDRRTSAVSPGSGHGSCASEPCLQGQTPGSCVTRHEPVLPTSQHGSSRASGLHDPGPGLVLDCAVPDHSTTNS